MVFVVCTRKSVTFMRIAKNPSYAARYISHDYTLSLCEMLPHDRISGRSFCCDGRFDRASSFRRAEQKSQRAVEAEGLAGPARGTNRDRSGDACANASVYATHGVRGNSSWK